ncbi:MAG: DEAD/DEAH box helicase, partial [Actinobacteria bacterium]|nr:DEAD/DEAH box helicase [Actinomycetota bacterium]
MRRTSSGPPRDRRPHTTPGPRHPVRSKPLPSAGLARLGLVTDPLDPTGPAAPPPSAAGRPTSPPSARALLREVFGFTEYRPHQEKVVEHLIGGGDAFVLMPTGGGKSLCYQIPAMVRPG